MDEDDPILTLATLSVVVLNMPIIALYTPIGDIDLVSLFFVSLFSSLIAFPITSLEMILFYELYSFVDEKSIIADT